MSAEAHTTGLELILNACEGALQIAVTDNEKPACFQEWFTPARATEILAPALEQICQRLGIAMSQFRRIGCFAGPGSFTGVRLVLATAAAIRRASHAQLASLDYLQALATSAVIERGLLYDGKVFVITHARRNLVHFQEFVSFGPQIPAQPVNEVSLIKPEEALAEIGKKECLVCGSGLPRHPELFALPVTGQGPKGAEKAIILPQLVNPCLAALCLLARHGDYFPTDVDPKYVRGCDAVENLVEREGSDAPVLKKLEELLARNPATETGAPDQE